MDEQRNLKNWLYDSTKVAAPVVLIGLASIAFGPYAIEGALEKIRPILVQQAAKAADEIAGPMYAEADKRLDKADALVTRLEKLFPRRGKAGEEWPDE